MVELNANRVEAICHLLKYSFDDDILMLLSRNADLPMDRVAYYSRVLYDLFLECDAIVTDGFLSKFTTVQLQIELLRRSLK